MKRIALFLAAVSLAAACTERNSERDISAMPVRLETAKRAPFAPSLVLTGVVHASETVPLVALTPGRVTYAPRFARGLRSGESVRAGELIADVRDDHAASLTEQARLQMEAANADFERAERSFKLGVLSSAEFSSSQTRAQLAKEQYNAAKKDLTRQRIVAPRAGRLVVSEPVAGGVEVAAGAKLAEIASGGAPIVEAAVAAADRDILHPGLVAKLAHGAWRGEGTIAEVAPVIDRSGTARVVIAIAHGDAPAPGTGVDVTIELERRPDVLSVPEDAIVAGSEGPAVFVVGQGAGWGNVFRVRRVDVETGGRADGRIEVRNGVRDGDRIVITGADSLSDGANVVEAKEGGA